MVKKEKIVVGLIASSKAKKNGKLEKAGRDDDAFFPATESGTKKLQPFMSLSNFDCT
jgi:hypothetical protein